jgi:hypothetical protein
VINYGCRDYQVVFGTLTTERMCGKV